MTSNAAQTFDLNEQIVETLEKEFGADALRTELRTAKPVDVKAFFADFGRRWMERVIELGEEYDDRTYQVLRAATAKTGHFAFPFVGERFVEIAYLSTQPIYTLPIVENGARGLVFKMPFCAFYKVIREELGEDAAAKLDCKAACLNACLLAFEKKGFKVSVGMDATMPADEYCQFAIRPA